MCHRKRRCPQHQNSLYWQEQNSHGILRSKLYLVIQKKKRPQRKTLLFRLVRKFSFHLKVTIIKIMKQDKQPAFIEPLQNCMLLSPQQHVSFYTVISSDYNKVKSDSLEYCATDVQSVPQCPCKLMRFEESGTRVLTQDLCSVLLIQTDPSRCLIRLI